MASRKGVCLVIGAGDGLGSAVARAFAAEGLTVCLTRRPRNLDRLEALAEEIRATGAAAHAFGCDWPNAQPRRSTVGPVAPKQPIHRQHHPIHGE